MFDKLRPMIPAAYTIGGALIICMVVLAGCGQKGDLYLPQQTSPEPEQNTQEKN